MDASNSVYQSNQNTSTHALNRSLGLFNLIKTHGISELSQIRLVATSNQVAYVFCDSPKSPHAEMEVCHITTCNAETICAQFQSDYQASVEFVHGLPLIDMGKNPDPERLYQFVELIEKCEKLYAMATSPECSRMFGPGLNSVFQRSRELFDGEIKEKIYKQVESTLKSLDKLDPSRNLYNEPSLSTIDRCKKVIPKLIPVVNAFAETVNKYVKAHEHPDSARAYNSMCMRDYLPAWQSRYAGCQILTWSSPEERQEKLALMADVVVEFWSKFLGKKTMDLPDVVLQEPTGKAIDFWGNAVAQTPLPSQDVVNLFKTTVKQTILQTLENARKENLYGEVTLEIDYKPQGVLQDILKTCKIKPKFLFPSKAMTDITNHTLTIGQSISICLVPSQS